MLHVPKTLVISLMVVAGIIFAFTLARSALFVTNSDDIDTGLSPTSTVTSPTSAASIQNKEGLPTRIRIPKIGVDATVVDVGLGKTGNMAVPLSYSDVGWYRYGTKPGGVGSAVMDGHVDNGFGLPAVFARLKELEEGDDIYIDTNEGSTLHFRVERGETYAVEAVPREMLFNRNDTARLNLVTCQGQWLPEQRMYDERHIVYAVFISS